METNAPETEAAGALRAAALPAPAPAASMGARGQRKLSAPAPDAREQMLALNSWGNWLQLAYMLLCFTSLATGVAAAEAVYSARLRDPRGNPLGASELAFSLKLATTLLTAGILLLLGVIHFFSYRLLQLQGHVLAGQSFFDSEEAWAFALEAAAMAVHAPVGCYALWTTINGGARIVYDADSLLSMFMFIRLKPFFMFLMNRLSGFHSQRAVLIATRVEVRMSAEVALRYLLKRFSILSTIVMYSISTLVLSYWMRVCERPACSQREPVAAGMCSGPLKDMENMTNAMYMAVITSLTVGYGDVTPVTNLGRFVAFLTALLGICVIALLVNAVNNYSKLDMAEDRVTELLELADRNVEKKAKAERLRRAFVLFWVGARARSALGAPGGGGGGSGGSSRAIAASAEGSAGASAVERLGGAAHARRYSRPLSLALAAWKRHMKLWDMARRRKDTLYLIRDDLMALRVRTFFSPPACQLLQAPFY